MRTAAGPDWPQWIFFPLNERSPSWVSNLVHITETKRDRISTESDTFSLDSNGVLAELADGFRGLGFEVEYGKASSGKVRRPVLFGENGRSTVTYEVDAAHDELGIVIEVEAGRGARGNAAYRDIIRTSLILDARYLVLFMPIVYRINKTGGGITKALAYRDTRDTLSAIYASNRLTLPFQGVLLIGY